MQYYYISKIRCSFNASIIINARDSRLKSYATTSTYTYGYPSAPLPATRLFTTMTLIFTIITKIKLYAPPVLRKNVIYSGIIAVTFRGESAKFAGTQTFRIRGRLKDWFLAMTFMTFQTAESASYIANFCSCFFR